MKNKLFSFILSALLVVGLATNCFAYADKTSITALTDTSGVAISSYALTSGVAVPSSGVKVRHNTGFATLIVTEDKAGGTGDVDIYAEYSIDNSTWLRAYTSDMAGTITVEGNVVTALQNVTRWIVFTPRMANYVRIVFDPDADSEVTASLLWLEDR